MRTFHLKINIYFILHSLNLIGKAKMKRTSKLFRCKRYGGVLISALVFTVVISMLLAGIGTLSVSHYARAKADGDYTYALDIGEAGVNYEFNKISKSPLQADGIGSGSGSAYQFGSGNFSVYVRNKSNNSVWTPGSAMYVYSTGTVNGVTRTIRVTGKSQGSSSTDYAMFGTDEGIIDQAGTNVGGDIGTNNSLILNNVPTITGFIDFNGPLAHWGSPPNHTYANLRTTATAVVYPTVDALANLAAPGGLFYFSTHNDNNLASQTISGNSILISTNMTLGSKTGGANYYLTGCTCNGSAKISFNNSLGPINVWVGPTGASGTFVFNGGSATVKNSNDPTKKVKIFVALNSDTIFNCTTRMDFGVYAYNTGSNGRVILNNNPNLYGTVIANKFTLNQTASVFYQTDYFGLSTGSYYGYDDSWIEQNPML